MILLHPHSPADQAVSQDPTGSPCRSGPVRAGSSWRSRPPGDARGSSARGSGSRGRSRSPACSRRPMPGASAPPAPPSWPRAGTQRAPAGSAPSAAARRAAGAPASRPAGPEAPAGTDPASPPGCPRCPCCQRRRRAPRRGRCRGHGCRAHRSQDPVLLPWRIREKPRSSTAGEETESAMPGSRDTPPATPFPAKGPHGLLAPGWICHLPCSFPGDRAQHARGGGSPPLPPPRCSASSHTQPHLPPAAGAGAATRTGTCRPARRASSGAGSTCLGLAPAPARRHPTPPPGPPAPDTLWRPPQNAPGNTHQLGLPKDL